MTAPPPYPSDPAEAPPEVLEHFARLEAYQDAMRALPGHEPRPAPHALYPLLGL